MTTALALYLLLAVLLLLLNAFFVLAEFAAVKMRSTRVEQLVAEGNAKAKVVQHVQGRLDEYLSVCQVGITFASIGLGFVGEPAFARMIVLATGLDTPTAHKVAVSISYLLVSFLHILLGELVPKSLAIRRAEGSALWTAVPLRFFRVLFWVPLVLLNGSANLILKLLGIPRSGGEDDHSEDELRIILAKSQRTGLMSFRRLLFLENIFDLGDIRVRDAMRLRDAVKVLRLGQPWEENLKVIRESRYSRFPLMDGGDFPVGIVHVKDLFYAGSEPDLRKIARPYLTTTEDAPLETLLGDLQRHRGHLAMVKNAEGRWTGFLSLEDIIEEIIGTIEDEFEVEPKIHLSDALSASRTVLGLEASSVEELIGQAFGRVPASELPLPVEKVVRAVLERERAMSTYLGRGLAIPHARLEGIERPILVFARSESGVPIPGRDEKAHLAFILLTPSGSPRIQARLLARICALIDSEYVADQLRKAETPLAVVEAIRAAEPTIS
jgi:CBS domain containing-hemolysin-like protein